MTILYVFPHPDDESFGPAVAMSHQVRAGHDVHLLTLTKGGATKVRHKLGLSIDEMGEVRYQEMQDVKKVLGLKDVTVLDFPDSGLKEVDPRAIEQALAEHIERVQPDVLVTYPVHGISGFHDHLIIHGIAKRVYLALQDAGTTPLRRLAFVTLDKYGPPAAQSQFHLSSSTEAEIDCRIEVDDADVQAMDDALDCYKTYTEVIEKSGVRLIDWHYAVFEIFQEEHDPPLTDLFEKLPAVPE